MVRTIKREEAPASMESLYRKIMGAAHFTEREIGHFSEMYMSNTSFDTELVIDFIKEMCEVLEKEFTSLQDFADVEMFVEANKDKERISLERLAQRKNKGKGKEKGEAAPNEADEFVDEPKVMYSETDEYLILQRMFNRAQAFEYVGLSVKNQLVDACSKLQTYCLSFVQETKGEVSKVVEEYENKIIDWKHTIQEKLDKIDELLDDYDKYKNKAYTYLDDYSDVCDIIREVCKIMVSLSDPVKKWVTSDSTYSRRIQEEINQCNRMKNMQKDNTRLLEDNRDKVAMLVKRKAFQVTNLEKEIDRVRDEKRNLKRREADTQENLARLRADVKRKRQDLQESKSRMATRKENSPSMFDYMSSLIESLRHEVRALEGKCAVLHRNILSLQRDQDAKQSEINDLDRQLRECRYAYDQLYQKIEATDHNVYRAQETMASLETRVSVLKKIREIKLHSSTVKKIFQHGYHAGHMQDRDDLKEAFLIASEEVGRDWQYLYKKLPFLPPRPIERRTHDIEVIDISHRRLHSAGFRTVTLKCLQKWRRLNNSASISDLIKTLKKLKKMDAVQRIQREVVLSSPSSKTRTRPFHYRKLAKSTMTV